MKHLKKYNESANEISLQDVKDILLELEDEKFEVIVDNTEYGSDVIKITINGPDYPMEDFKYHNVKETLLRLKDYLGSHWKFGSVMIYNYDYEEVDKFNIESFDEGGLCIYGNEYHVQDATESDITSIEIYFNY